MSLETRLVTLAQAVGADIRTILGTVGSLSALDTNVKTNLVAALNELKLSIDQIETGSVGINDNISTTTTTWSSSRISTAIENAFNALVASSPAALNTLQELADALGNDPNFATSVATEIAHRVRFDSAQTLTATQQETARQNINAASASSFSGLVTALGNIERDLAAEYVTAKL